jgi:hypothetical protein
MTFSGPGAFAGPDLRSRCYAAAIGRGHLWHEFGELRLLLPWAGGSGVLGCGPGGNPGADAGLDVDVDVDG